MKNLYESILTSTGAGAGAVSKRIEEWLRSLKMEDLSEADIKVENVRKGFEVIIKAPKNPRMTYLTIGKLDTDNPIYDSKWHITRFVNGYTHAVLDMTYRNIVVTDDELPDEVGKSITFLGCSINISKLPINCETLNFPYMHTLDGGRGTNFVKPLRGISVKEISVGTHHRGNSGLSGSVATCFRNCTIDKIDITDGMLGYWSIEPGNRKITEAAGKLIDEFISKNKVNEKGLIYHLDPQKAKSYKKGYLIKDKTTGLWKIKPIKD